MNSFMAIVVALQMMQLSRNTARVMKKMKHLQSTCPEQLSPDTLSVVTEPNVWSKRAILLK